MPGFTDGAQRASRRFTIGARSRSFGASLIAASMLASLIAAPVAAGSTVASLLASLDLDPRLVVVERNREILRDRDSFPRVELATGDTIEIVHFVGGG